MSWRFRPARRMVPFLGSLLALMLGLFSTAAAATLFEENFNFTSGSTLIGQGGWVQTGTASTPVISIASGSLTYPAYASSGLFNMAALGASGDDNNHPFIAQTGGNVYASALINVSAAQATGDYFMHFAGSTVGSNFGGRVFAKSSGAGFVLGLSKGTEAATYGTTVYSFNTTYLVVLKYIIVGGATNDQAALFVSPTVGAAEPAADISSVSTGTDLANVGAFCLRQGSAAGAPTLTVDGIRVGSAWADAVTPVVTYTLTATAGANGTISPAGVTTVNSGGGQSYTITANAGYHVADVTVDGVSQGATGSYSFTNVTSNRTIDASFAIDTYTITATAGANGTVTPAGVTTVNSGGNQSYAIAADAGYHIADVLVDGVSVGAVASHDFTNVAANHTIAASFAIDTYTITATAGANGTVTPAGVTTVNSGGNQSYAIAADAGYHIADVLVDGVSVGAVASHDFTNVTANHTIAASFAVTTAPAIVSAVSPAGVITPSTPSVLVPVNLVRPYATPNRAFHVSFQLGGGLTLTGGTAGVTQGTFLSENGATTSFHVIDEGGGLYSVDGSILGVLCNATGLSGNLFNIAVSSIAPTGPGSVTLTDLDLRDCDNVPLPSAMGTAASVAIDNSYTITATAGANGTMTPAGVTTVPSGGSQSYAIAANAGYHVADVLVDGVSVGAVASHDFTAVTANHTIEASFAIDTYTITATAGANGTVTPAGVTTVPSGGSQSYAIAANAGYHVADVLVDGVSVGAVASHDFTAVTANHTIEASFAIDTYTITATAGANGTVTPAGVTTVPSGGSQSYAIAANAGYHVADVLVDGVSVGAVTSHDFTAVTANHTIEASFAVDAAIVSAGSPTGILCPNTPSLTVPVTINRPFGTPNRLFHVKFQLGGGLTLSGGTSGVTVGGFLSANGAAVTFQVVDNGGGSYTADGSILGLPCNATGLTGTLFNIALASAAASGPGTVTLTEVTLRDCDNSDLVAAIGTAASVTIDNTPPAIAVVAPNGGEYWVRGSSQAITWTASDAAGLVANPVSLELSTNNGSTWSPIATGLANSGSYAWTVPASASSTARVRVNATDTNGNVGHDASDAAFTIAGTSSVALSASPIPSVSGDAVLLTATVAPVAPEVGVPSGTVTFFDGLASIGTGTLNGSGVATLSSPLAVVGVHSLTATYGGDASFATSTSAPVSQEVKAKIVASAGANGSVSPSGTTTYSLNATPTFTFTASAGYHVADVLVDAASVGPMPGYTFAPLTANHTLAVSFAVNPAVPALTGLAAVQVKSGNDLDGTTKVTITWPSVGANKTVMVYRSGYGNYPEYDDAPNAGSVPPTPSYPPPATWQLTGVATSGDADEVATRDLWYFVAFVQDQYGTISPASNLAGGVLNYYLGDVSDGSTPGHGNNVVDLADVTLLGAHYGISGPAVTPYDYLDVGPTTNHTVDGRPVTDNLLDFEDLIMFAINFQTVSAPQASIRPALVAAATDALTLDVPGVFTQGRATARLQLSGTGVVQGLSAKLSWDPAVVAVESFAPGALLDEQGAIALSGKPGVVDIVRLGLGGALVGTGEVAAVTFRRLGEGDPKIAIASVDARDAANRPVAIAFESRNPPAVPQFTSFDRVAPNPARGSATLAFALAQGGPVDLTIYGVDGRLVRSLLRGTREAGAFQIAWDGRDDAGRTAAVGVYFARLVTPQGRFTRSLIFLQ